MIELFQMGGMLFMSIITLGLVVVLVGIAKAIMGMASANNKVAFALIKQGGLFAVVMGILGQMIGLYSAFAAIEQMGGVSPEMLISGLKVSSIPTIYGLLVFGIAMAATVVFSFLKKSETTN